MGSLQLDAITLNTVLTDIDNLRNINGTLYFEIVKVVKDEEDNDISYYELWKSDGTAEGSDMIYDFGTDSVSVNELIEVNDTLYFPIVTSGGDYELWKSDGTTGGTELVKDFGTDSISDFIGYESTVTIPIEYQQFLSAIPTSFDGGLFFRVNDTYWAASNGTADGTGEDTNGFMQDVKVIGDTFYASANVYGFSAVVSYTEANSVQYLIGPGFVSADNLADDGNNLYFTSFTTLYINDGTSNSITAIYTPSSDVEFSHFTAVNGTTYFLENDAGTYTLWSSDGTENGAQTVLTLDGITPSDLVNVGGTLYLTGSDSSDSKYKLWSSDGTQGNKTELASFDDPLSNLTAVNGVLYFTASDSQYGEELWSSDGTVEGTAIVEDLSSGTTGSSPTALTEINGSLYLIADDGSGEQLYTLAEVLPQLSINDVEVNEGDSGTTNAEFTVTLSEASDSVVTVDFQTSPETNGDYTEISDTLTFAVGETEKTITVAIAGDTDIESDETFNVILSNASNAEISDDTGVGTILNDDTAIVFPPTYNSQAFTVNGDYTAVTGDFDGSGTTDILWYQPGRAADYLWSFNGDGSYNSQAFTVNGDYTAVTGDFDGSGTTDILWYTPGTGADYLWSLNGDGTYDSQPFTVNGDYTAVTGDFDGSGTTDILWYQPGRAADYLWSFNEDGTYDSEAFTVNGDYTAVTGDFDGNDVDDILWYKPGTGADYLWGFSQDGTYESAAFAVNGDYTAVTGDFDGSNTTDILWYKPGTGADYLWSFGDTDVV